MQVEPIFEQLDILNHIQHGIIVIDPEGTIIYWNRASEEIFGYSFTEIEGKSLRLLYEGEEIMPFDRLLKNCSDKKSYKGRWRIKCKNGTRIWVDLRSGTFLSEDDKHQYCVISVNKTDKLEIAKRRLQEVEVLGENLLETSVDAILTTSEKGHILSFNRAAVELFGYRKHEIIGKKVHQLIPSFYSENHNLFIKSFNEAGDKITNGGKVDFKGLRKDGTIIHINLSVSEVPWKGSRIFLAIIRDQTQKRELERQLLDIANEERRRIGRELHDGLGQMLTGIRMISENLARKLKANEIPGAGEVLEISNMIKEADEHARALSHGLVEVDLERIGLSCSLKNLAARIPKTHGVQCTYTEIGQVDFENRRMILHIYRIVQEAVTNALRHAEAENIHIRMSKNKLHTSVIIEDDGIGFAPEDLSEKGSGIQIMKYRADILGGLLDIYRTEDDKTQVRCIIPNNLDYFDEPG